MGGEGDGGDMGGVMARQKGKSWVATGEPNFYPLKPMQWLQRAQSSPNTQKGGGLLVLTLGRGGWGNKQNVFLVVAATVAFVKNQQNLLCVAEYILAQ
eukprot:11220118-Ditylum_brightwellii.AAC.1